MPIPKPRADEPKRDFLERCISFIEGEGTPHEQAVAICFRQYEESPRAQRWFKVEKKRRRYEIWMQERISVALKKLVEPVAGAETIEAMKRAKTNKEPLTEALTEAYEKVGGAFAVETYKELSEKYIKSRKREVLNFDGFIKKWARETAGEKVVQIDEATLRHIRRSIEDGTDNLESIDEIATRIADGWATSAVRARRIARTEVVGASNRGSLLGAEATGLAFNKVWLSAQDGRTRALSRGDKFDHLNADGEKVPNGAFFRFRSSKGGLDFLEYPGDQRGDVANIVNCRCTLGYEDIVDVGNDGADIEPLQAPFRSPVRDPIKPIIPRAPKPPKPKPPKPIDPVKPKPTPADPDVKPEPALTGVPDELGFVPAKSFEEAEEYARKVLGFEEVSGFDKTGSLELVNEYNKAMLWSQQKFGKGDGGILRYVNTGSQRDGRRMTSDNTYGFCAPNTMDGKKGDYYGLIHFNAQKGRAMEVHKEVEARYAQNGGWFFQGIKVGSTSAHEYAHYITVQMMNMDIGYVTDRYDPAQRPRRIKFSEGWRGGGRWLKENIFKKVQKKMGYRTQKEMREQGVREFGEYSGTNWHEFLAMAIEYEYCHPNQSALAGAIIEVVQDEMKRLRRKKNLIARYRW